MAKIFEVISLTWKGEEYKIEPNRVMGAIASIEEYVTLKELHESGGKGTLKLAALAQGYAAVLQYAGATVTADEVYASMFEKGSGRDMIVGAVNGLISMMVPPSSLRKLNGSVEAQDAGNQLTQGSWHG